MDPPLPTPHLRSIGRERCRQVIKRHQTRRLAFVLSARDCLPGTTAMLQKIQITIVRPTQSYAGLCQAYRHRVCTVIAAIPPVQVANVMLVRGAQEGGEARLVRCAGMGYGEAAPCHEQCGNTEPDAV